jgi:hypothetical protein
MASNRELVMNVMQCLVETVHLSPVRMMSTAADRPNGLQFLAQGIERLG